MDAHVLSWCERMVGCRSVTREGTREIVEMCARDLLSPAGINARIIPSSDEGPNQVNLLAVVKGSDSAVAPLVLNTHLDTVPPGDPAMWTECGGDPFAAKIKNGRIYGLGAADTKLDFIAKVTALASSPPRRDIYLVATFGEEHGLVGAKEIAAAGLLPAGAPAFIGEASHCRVITAHKGLMVFRLTAHFTPERADTSAPARRIVFTGRAAHSSTPDLGVNAIRAALDAIAGCPGIRIASIAGGDAVNKVPARCELIVTGGGTTALAQSGERTDAPGSEIPAAAIAGISRFIDRLRRFADSAGPPEPDYAAPTLTCNPGVIRSDADSITLEFELRPPPSLALDAVRQGVDLIARELAATSTEVRMELREGRANPGFRAALDSETVEIAMAALARAGLPLETGVKAGCTEAGIYAAAGLKPVVFGPGPSTGVIHAPNEYNLVEDVDGAIRFYAELMRL